MKQRKLLTSLFLAATLSISLLTGCGNTSSSTSETKQTENSATEEQTTSVQKESGRLFWQMNTISCGSMTVLQL